MSTITINEPTTLLEVASLNATLPLRLKTIRDKVNKTLTGPEQLTTPISLAMSLVELAEAMLKEVCANELEKQLEPVEEREGRFTVSGYTGKQMLKTNVPIEHVGTAMFQAGSFSLALVGLIVQKAEDSLKLADEYAKFTGIPETPAS